MAYRFSQIDTPVENPFRHDALERREPVTFVADLIERTGQKGPFVLAIDAAYGAGKSTFIAMLRSVLTCRDFYSVHFNAWQVDNTTDPLVPMVSVLDQAMRSELVVESKLTKSLDAVRKVTAAVAKRGAIAAAKAATLGGLDLEKEIEAVASSMAGDLASDIVAQFQKEQDLAMRFRSELAKAVQQLPHSNKKSTLVFFIDELDRCRPDFAISLLERIKHMFDIENVVFVLAIDKPQLESVTAAIYGEQINAAEYLRKFIDIEFGLPRPSSKRFVEISLGRLALDDMIRSRGQNGIMELSQFIRFFSAIADALELSLRAQERCLTRVKVVLEQTSSSQDFSPVLVALLVVLRSMNQSLFSKFVSQRAEISELLSFFKADSNGQLRDSDRVVIEATLVSEVKDNAKRNEWVERYNVVRTQPGLSNSLYDYADRFMNIVSSLENRMEMPGTVMSIIARRIDMAANIRD